MRSAIICSVEEIRIHTWSWPSGNSESQENCWLLSCPSVPILPFFAFFVMLSLGYENHHVPTSPVAT